MVLEREVHGERETPRRDLQRASQSADDVWTIIAKMTRSKSWKDESRLQGGSGSKEWNRTTRPAETISRNEGMAASSQVENEKRSEGGGAKPTESKERLEVEKRDEKGWEEKKEETVSFTAIYGDMTIHELC